MIVYYGICLICKYFFFRDGKIFVIVLEDNIVRVFLLYRLDS